MKMGWWIFQIFPRLSHYLRRRSPSSFALAHKILAMRIFLSDVLFLIAGSTF